MVISHDDYISSNSDEVKTADLHIYFNSSCYTIQAVNLW